MTEQTRAPTDPNALTPADVERARKSMDREDQHRLIDDWMRLHTENERLRSYIEAREWAKETMDLLGLTEQQRTPVRESDR